MRAFSFPITDRRPAAVALIPGRPCGVRKQSMTATNEFRVRPVTRFILTHFHEQGRSASVRSLGEFDRIEDAEEIGVALNLLVPGSVFTTLEGRPVPEYPSRMLASAVMRDRTEEYVIVAVQTHEVDNFAYFATDPVEAERLKVEAEQKHGKTFRIYSG